MEDLVLTFTGVNLVSRVTRQIGGDLATLEGQANSLGSRISGAWSTAASSLMSFAKIGFSLDLLGGGAIVAAAKNVASLDFQMQVLQTHAGFTGNIDKYKSAIQGIANQTGILATTLTKNGGAAYDISSFFAGGPNKGNIPLQSSYLLDAAKTAAMTGSDPGDTAKVVTGLMANFPKQFRNVQQASAQLNTVVGSGVMTMQDFATAMHTGLLGIAGDTKQSFAEVGSALGVLTRNNYTAQGGATGLRNVLIQLSKGSPEHVKAFQAIGISQENLVDQMNSPNGLIGALTVIKDHLKGLDAFKTSTFWTQVSGGTRGMPQLETLVNNLPQVTQLLGNVNAQSGTFDKLWAAFQAQPQQQWAKLKSSLVTLSQDAVQPLMGGLGSLMGTIDNVVNKADAWVKANPKLIEQIAQIVGKVAIFAPALAGVVGILMKFVTLVGSPVRLVLTILAGALASAHGKFGSLGEAMNSMSGVASWLSGALAWIGNTLTQTVIPAVQQFFKWLSDSGTLKNITDGLKAIGNGMEGLFNGSSSQRNSMWTDIKNAIHGFSEWFAADGAKDIIGATKAIMNVFGLLYTFIVHVVIPPILSILGIFQAHTTLSKLAVETLLTAFAVQKVISFATAIGQLGKALYSLTLIKKGSGILGTLANGAWALSGKTALGRGIGTAALYSYAAAVDTSAAVKAAPGKAGKWVANIAQIVAANVAGAAKIARNWVSSNSKIVANAVASGAKRVGAWIADNAKAEASDAKLIAQTTAASAKSAAKWIASHAKIVGNAAVSATKLVGTWGKAGGKIAATFIAETVVPMLAGWAEVAADAVASAATATAAFLVSPVGLFLIALAAIIALFVLVITHLKQIGQIAGEVWNSFVSALRAVATAIYNAIILPFLNFQMFILHLFANAGTWLMDAGRNLIVGFVNGVKSVGTWVLDAILSLLGPLEGAAKKILGIASPSRVFADIGRNVVLGMVQGIDNNAGLVNAALEGAMPGVGSSHSAVNFRHTLTASTSTQIANLASQQQEMSDNQTTLLQQMVVLLQQLLASLSNATPSQRTGIEAQIQALLRNVNTARGRGIRSVT